MDIMSWIRLLIGLFLMFFTISGAVQNLGPDGFLRGGWGGDTKKTVIAAELITISFGILITIIILY